MSNTRKQFEKAKSNLQKEESEAVSEFEAAKSQHIKVDGNLNHDKDVITVEEQTAEQSKDAAEGDLETNNDEKRAAEDYLQQLGKSCYPLLSLRRAEEAA